MAYAAASDVYSHVRSLVLPSGSFDTSTCPTLTDVNFWLSSGCSVINAHLAGAGYSAIGATSAAYGIAQAANALYGAWFAEQSRLSARVSADERVRADRFKKDFFDHLDMLTALDLGRMGVTRQVSGIYFGGISNSDKETVASDTDRVVPRFSRGMGRNPETIDPEWNAS